MPCTWFILWSCSLCNFVAPCLDSTLLSAIYACATSHICTIMLLWSPSFVIATCLYVLCLQTLSSGFPCLLLSLCTSWVVIWHLPCSTFVIIGKFLAPVISFCAPYCAYEASYKHLCASICLACKLLPMCTSVLFLGCMVHLSNIVVCIFLQ